MVLIFDISSYMADDHLFFVFRLFFFRQQVDELCTAGNALDEATMVHFVTNTTMVG